MIQAARQVLARMGRTARAGIVASAGLRFIERCVLVVVAISFVRAEPRRALVVTVALAVLYGLHGALRATLSRLNYARLATIAVRALIERDPLAGLAKRSEEDEQQAIFEGLSRGEILATELLPDLAGNGAAAVALIVFLSRVAAPRLLLVGVVAMLFAAVAAGLVRRLVTRAEARSHAAFIPVIDTIVAAIRGRVELVVSGRGALFAARSDGIASEWRRVSSAGDRIAAFAGRAPVAAATLAVGLVVVLDRAAGSAPSIGALGEGAIFASVVPSFAGAARAIVEIARSGALLEPLADLLGTAPPRPAAPHGRPLPPLPATVELKDVAFAYPSPAAPRRVLRDLSLRWGPKSALVVTGPNGSGKSTLLRLVLGLGEPSAGTIELGGAPLGELDLPAWRRSIAYLAQRPYLPERATVREAISLFALDVPEAAVLAALGRVDVLGALREMKPREPLDVPIGVLSTGQRQRVALARVLCQDAPVVLLDEPDANLDAAGIRLVAALVREMAAEKMVAVVAHSSELLAGADLVLRLGSAMDHVGSVTPGGAV